MRKMVIKSSPHPPPNIHRLRSDSADSVRQKFHRGGVHPRSRNGDVRCRCSERFCECCRWCNPRTQDSALE